ncbi:MAG: MBL fold metallo-hydrolase [Alphaproteobacteria bacterium]|nr:MAG: MBL fold metallo-hydrolase [Alphaproteobacteria bacterium]
MELAGRKRRGLIYPFEMKPDRGTITEIVPGIFWLRMSLPFVLNHINLWLIRDHEGWSIVDTGLRADETREDWEKIFDNQLDGKPITRVICTHMHPDHVGLAGWIVSKWDAEFWMTRTDYLLGRILANDTGREAPDIALRFYRAAGFTERALDIYKQRFGAFGSFISHMPDSFRRIVDGEMITIGEHEWQVVVGRGHSPEHACLYCPDLNVLISGDQVLPRISSIVSLYPTEPSADPLDEWLNSCVRLRERLPEDLLVLPSHNEPFYGLHTRLGQLIKGHEDNLDRLYAALEEPKRAVDVFSQLFKSKIDANNYLMATGESLSHLKWLVNRGKATCQRDKAGVDWYKRV